MLREFPLPGRLAERVDADGRPLHEPPPVRAAATVLLLRNRRDSGVEVFAFRRVARMVFAPGMLAFPGGSVDDADADPALPWDVPVDSVVDAAPAPVLAAAVRETFEECGVLLARSPAGPAPDAGELASPIWKERRIGLAEGRLTLAGVLTEAGLVATASALHAWARWVTPEFERRRFDTWFYLAQVPARQEARDLGGEGELATWLDPADALERHAAGELPMLPPTQVCLEELAGAASAEELLATPRTVRPVSPSVERGEEGLVLRIDLDGRGGGAAR